MFTHLSILATARSTGSTNQIEATDRQIDWLVYELYGLTDDEVRIIEPPAVEEATAR